MIKRTLDENSFGKELAKLLKNKKETVKTICFGNFKLHSARKLFDYYRTCNNVRADLENDFLLHSRVSLRKRKSGSFEVELINDQIRYRRSTKLPNEVKPYFKKLVSEFRKRRGKYVA